MQFVEPRSLSYSIALHGALLLIAAVGLPLLLPKAPDPEPTVMSVEILPMGEITNVKPSDKTITEEKHAPAAKAVKPLPPAAEKPQPKSTPPAPAPKQEKAKEVEEKPFDPMEGEEPTPAAKTEKPKPVEKPKPAAPTKEATQPKNDDFAALLNKLKQENTAPPKDAKDKTNAEANKTKSDAPYDASLPLSLSEKDSIKGQFIPCWNQSAFMGAKDPHSLAARIKVTLQADGTVTDARLASDQEGRYNSDSFFRAAADAALRAVHRCSPLKNLPPDKYGSWRTMELNFDPADLL